ncbi:MAG: hypothetical protein ACFFDT_26240 [Candidatus Hodarchaeota archaeon]
MLNSIIILIFVCCFSSVNSFAAEKNVQSYIENVLLDEGSYGDPPKAQQLIEYSKHSGVTMGEINAILIKIMKNNCLNPENSLSDVICRFSMEIIGDFKNVNALSTLAEIEQHHKKEYLQVSAAESILSVGGDGVIDYANKLLNETRYSDTNRFRFYELLGSQISGKHGEQIKQLLVNAATKETSIGNVLKIDKLLSDDRNYRNSYYRESILEKIGSSKIEKHIEYSSTNLQQLQSIAEGQRTIFKLRPQN